MRPRRRCLLETDRIHHPRPELLHLVHDLGQAVGEVVEGEQRDQRDEQPDRGGDQRLRDAAGHATGIDEALRAEEVERPDHAGDGAEQAQQRRGGHDRFENPEPAAERLLDERGLFGGPGLHPPGGLGAVVEDHPEEAAEVVAGVQLPHALLEIGPRESVCLEHLEQRAGQAGARDENERLLQDDDHRHHREQEQRIDHGAAHAEGRDETLEILHW